MRSFPRLARPLRLRRKPLLHLALASCLSWLLSACTPGGEQPEGPAGTALPPDPKPEASPAPAAAPVEKPSPPPQATPGTGKASGPSSLAPALPPVTGSSGAGPAPPADGGGNSGDRLDELRATVERFVRAIDEGKASEVEGFFVDAAFLKEHINAGNYEILAGALLPENATRIREILKVAEGQDVKLVSWKPGKAIVTQPGKSIFTREVPLVGASLLEIDIGDVRVALSLRQSVRTPAGAWRILELAVEG